MGFVPLNINTVFFENVQQFKYLGTIFTCNNDLKLEIKNRLSMVMDVSIALENNPNQN